MQSKGINKNKDKTNLWTLMRDKSQREIGRDQRGGTRNYSEGKLIPYDACILITYLRV